MKPRFYAFLIVLLPVLLQAQNYQSVSGSDQYFARTTQYADYDNIIAMHIDSVQNAQNGDTYYFPYRIMRDTSFNWDECVMDTAAPSFAGKQITLKTNGDNIFLNDENKELLIKTGAALNDEWDFAMIDNITFKAKISNHSIQTISGITDSIKSIELQAFDQSGNQIENLMNGKKLLLSKEHGLLSVLNFYEFPNDSAEYHYTDYQPLTWGDIYNFEIGDYFIYCYNALNHNIPPSYEVTEILSRQASLNNDSITYSAKIINVNNSIEWYPEPHIVTTVHDTIKEITYTSLNQLVAVYLPHQHNNQTCISNYSTLSNKPFCSNTELFTILLNYSRLYDCDLSTGCYVPAFEGMEGYTAYTQGLGKTKVYQNDWSGFSGFDHYLQYYRKGTESWGDPTILSNPMPEKIETLNIAPNPASDEINVFLLNSLSNAANIEIYSVDGRKEIQKAVTSISHDNIIQMDISTLPSGLHFLVLKSGNEVHSLTFIKK